MIGETIGLYEITRLLGQGGMGAVYLAEHTRLGSRKVVKVLLPEYSRDPQVVARFENEARAAASLVHRNIIKIDDFGQLPCGQWYILMPHLEGSSLEAFLASHGKLTVHQALHVLAQVCAALHVAHGAGIVHRDLKPGNIFLSQTEDNPRHVTLLDFGIAKLGGREGGMATQTGAVFGTPAYMAVEQLEDASRADARSDVFALGVIAYQMVTGELPFGQASGAVLYNRQITTRPKRPSGVPFEWAELILRALAVRPVDRPASARDFALSLAAVTSDDPPFEPNGHEIVLAVARELVTHAPHDAETVRHAEASDVAVEKIWSAPASDVSEAAAGAPPSAGLAVPAAPTTMTALAGSRGVAPSRARKTWWAAGLGALALVAIVVFVRRAGPASRLPQAASNTGVSEAAARVDAAAPDAGAVASPATVAAVDFLIDSYPRRAMIIVNGKAMGSAPQTVRATPGTQLEVRAEASGYVPLTRTLTVSEEPVTAVMSLLRAKPSKPSTKPAAKPTGGPAPFDPDAAGGQ